MTSPLCSRSDSAWPKAFDSGSLCLMHVVELANMHGFFLVCYTKIKFWGTGVTSLFRPLCASVEHGCV